MNTSDSASDTTNYDPALFSKFVYLHMKKKSLLILSVRFWHDVWVGNCPLKIAFPRLFSILNLKEGKVSDLGVWGALS